MPQNISKNNMTMTVFDCKGQVKVKESNKDYIILVHEYTYETGDYIVIQVPVVPGYYKIRIDDCMNETLVYLTEKEIIYRIPFDEKKKSYNPKAFTGDIHYLSCRFAYEYEIYSYRNLSENVIDQHEAVGCYPHARANVETRGESVFAARNAIDGFVANRCHGSWPFESWGINMKEDAYIELLFGRAVNLEKIVLWTRADFPHDNWWIQAELSFSDETKEQISLIKTEKPQEFKICKKDISWIRLENLIKADDPSPFPALTQIEVYGLDKKWEV
jgi:hypothetical protein